MNQFFAERAKLPRNTHPQRSMKEDTVYNMTKLKDIYYRNIARKNFPFDEKNFPSGLASSKYECLSAFIVIYGN